MKQTTKLNQDFDPTAPNVVPVKVTNPGDIGGGGGYEVVGLKNSSDTRIDPATEATLANVDSTLSSMDLTVNDINTALGEVQASPTANTVLDRLKALKTSLDSVISSAKVQTEVVNTPDVKNKYVLPLGTNTSSTITLTLASTAYQITEPTSDFIVTYCNMSDTDMYWGFATLNSGGILLPKNGGTLILKCAANNSPFFYCASAGKVLNYSTTIV